MIKTGIIGASGHTGEELVRLLSKHPKFKITYLTSEKFKGQKLSPSLLGATDIMLESFSPSKAKKSADVFFVALPHGTSMEVVPKLLGGKKKVVDLSGDFRLEDQAVYKKWYKKKHTSSNLLGKAVYGLPEINKKAIKEANFVTNPGCYPTSVILALAPLLKKGLVFEKDIIIDSKSGVSGAGKINEKANSTWENDGPYETRTPEHTPSTRYTKETNFDRVDESVKAYGVAVHKHTPEIEQEASKISKEEVTVSFTPHLIPMNRGILSTCYCDLKEDLNTKEIIEMYKKTYKGKSFVQVLDEGNYPETKNVLGSNHCHIGMKVDSRTGRAIVISAIDNLVKGASGQAIQNMNLMCGFKETEGLKDVGLVP